MGMVGGQPLRAWSVGVMAQVGGGGTALTSIFVMARTPGEAVAAGVRHLFDSLTGKDGGTPLITICSTQSTEISRDAIAAAAAELGAADETAG